MNTNNTSWGYSGIVGAWESEFQLCNAALPIVFFEFQSEKIEDIIHVLQKDHVIELIEFSIVDYEDKDGFLQEKNYVEDATVKYTSNSKNIISKLKNAINNLNFRNYYLTNICINLSTKINSKNGIQLVPTSSTLMISVDPDWSVLVNSPTAILSYETYIDVWLSETLDSNKQWRNNKEYSDINSTTINKLIEQLKKTIQSDFQATKSDFYTESISDRGFYIINNENDRKNEKTKLFNSSILIETLKDKIEGDYFSKNEYEIDFLKELINIIYDEKEIDLEIKQFDTLEKCHKLIQKLITEINNGSISENLINKNLKKIQALYDKFNIPFSKEQKILNTSLLRVEKELNQEKIDFNKITEEIDIIEKYIGDNSIKIHNNKVLDFISEKFFKNIDDSPINSENLNEFLKEFNDRLKKAKQSNSLEDLALYLKSIEPEFIKKNREVLQKTKYDQSAKNAITKALKGKKN